METMQAIHERRSIRRFRTGPIETEKLKKIVRAGAAAATAGNHQPWRFIIVDEPGTVSKTTDTLGWLAGEPGEDERPAAHVVILVPEGASWSAQADGAAAAQNMLLAATDMGIGSCWFGSIKRDRLAELLEIPADWHIYSVVALGHPAETPEVVQGEDTSVTRRDDGQLVVSKKPLDGVLSSNRFE